MTTAMDNDYPYGWNRTREPIGIWEGVLAWLGIAFSAAGVVVAFIVPLWSIYCALAWLCGWPALELWRAFLVVWILALLYLIGEGQR